MKRSQRTSIVVIATLLMVLLAVPAFAEGQKEKQGEEEIYIPLVSKGLQHQFWQTVKSGAEDAAEELGVSMTFEGPTSEAAIQEQVRMFKSALAKNPSAVALAALDTESVRPQLEEAKRRDIPVIGFDSGVPNPPEGSVYANASTNNYAAAGLAAEKMFEEIQGEIENASASSPITITVLSQDATSLSVTERGKGFRDRMIELITNETGHSRSNIKVQGNPAYVADDNPTGGQTIIIDMIVAQSPRTQDVTAAANSIMNRVDEDNIQGLFLSNEGSVVGVLAATNDGSELASEYSDVTVVGFDAGEAQKNAVRNDYFLGSITQDPYQIGYKAVELSYKAAQGQEVSDVDTGAKFYTDANMDDEDIAPLLYD
jgi:ribose transport system substrate-binding protein